MHTLDITYKLQNDDKEKVINTLKFLPSCFKNGISRKSISNVERNTPQDIPCSVSDPNIVYLSTSTLLETQGTVTLKEFSSHTFEEIEKIAVGVIDIVDPPRLGFQLTLGIHLNNIPRRKDINSRHVEGTRLDKTVWNLLNFYAYVKYHIKCTRGFIQSRMRKRMDSLVKLLYDTSLEEEAAQKENGRCKYVKDLVKVPIGKLMMKRDARILQGE